MNRINCDVTNCSHNSKHICYANMINVGGKSAQNDSDTCCASFLDSSTYSHLTSNVNDHGNPCSAIGCNVHTCTYNSNNLCTANSIHVNVNGTGANLYSETDCETFRTT